VMPDGERPPRPKPESRIARALSCITQHQGSHHPQYRQRAGDLSMFQVASRGDIEEGSSSGNIVIHYGSDTQL